MAEACDPGATRASGRVRWDAALVAFAAAFAWFASGAARGLPFEDAGLLASAAWTLGVPHPPGYPLWTLLGGAWARALAALGVDVVLALSLLSAGAAAATASVLAAWVRARGASLAIAVGVAVGPLAVAPTFAAQAVTIEVYALAGLCQACALVLAFAARPRPRATALALGLGLTAHPGTLWLAPALLAVALVRARARPLRVAATLSCLALPLALYAYVPLAAALDPAVSWGEATGGSALLDHLLRRQYATGLERDWSGLFVFLSRDGVAQGLPVLLALALTFVFRGFERERREIRLLFAVLLVALASAAAAIAWPMTDENRVRLAGSLVPLVVVSVAIGGCAAALVERAASPRLGRRWPAAIVLAVVGLRMLGVVADPEPDAALATEARLADRAGAEPYARALLGALPPDAVLVVNHLGHTDVLGFPLLFAQVVRGVRRDVTLVDRGLLPARWYRAQLARRAPDLAPALAQLDALFASRPEHSADPRSRRLAAAPFLDALFAGPRPLAFTDAPGDAVLQGRELVPGPLHLEWVPAGASSDRARALLSLPPAPPEAAAPEAGPWSGLFAELAAERAAFRARLATD